MDTKKPGTIVWESLDRTNITTRLKRVFTQMLSSRKIQLVTSDRNEQPSVKTLNAICNELVSVVRLKICNISVNESKIYQNLEKCAKSSTASIGTLTMIVNCRKL